MQQFQQYGDQQMQQFQQHGGQPMQQEVPETATSLAGLLIMSGVLPKDAYVQGAKMFHEQENARIQQHKQQVKQNEKMQFMQLADYIRNNPNASNQEIAARALESGGGFANIPAFVNMVGTQEQIINDAYNGPTIFRKNAGVYEQPGGNLPSGNGGQNLSPDANAFNGIIPPVNSTTNATMNRKEGLAKFKSDLKKSELNHKATEEWREEITSGAKAGAEVVKNAGILRRAIPKMYSGSFADTKYGLSKASGADEKAIAATEIFDKMTAQVIRDLESSKSQRVTDSARDLIIATKPQRTNSEKGNISVVNALDAYGMLEQERAKAAEEWAEKGGDRHKFEILWNQFQEQYPSISLNEDTGMLDVHKENIKKWRKVLFGESNEDTLSDQRTPDMNADQELLDNNFKKLQSLLSGHGKL